MIWAVGSYESAKSSPLQERILINFKERDGHAIDDVGIEALLFMQQEKLSSNQVMYPVEVVCLSGNVQH